MKKTLIMYAGGIIAGLIIAYLILVYGKGNVYVSIGVATGVVVLGILYEVVKKRKTSQKPKEIKKEGDNNHDITSEPLY